MNLLAAPSGTGKSTMDKRLFEDFPNLIFSISATTRPPREDESHGVDYYFLNMDEFQQKIDDRIFFFVKNFMVVLVTEHCVQNL